MGVVLSVILATSAVPVELSLFYQASSLRLSGVGVRVKGMLATWLRARMSAGTADGARFHKGQRNHYGQLPSCGGVTKIVSAGTARITQYEHKKLAVAPYVGLGAV